MRRTSLQNNVWPTIADAKAGIKRLTFNFDFVRRNVKNDANYINQQMEKASSQKKKIQKAVEKTQDVLDIIVEQADEENLQ